MLADDDEAVEDDDDDDGGGGGGGGAGGGGGGRRAFVFVTMTNAPVVEIRMDGSSTFCNLGARDVSVDDVGKLTVPLLPLLGCPSRTRFFCRNSSKRDLKSNDEAAAVVDSCINNASEAVAEAAVADEDDDDDEEEDDDDDDAITLVLPIGRLGSVSGMIGFFGDVDSRLALTPTSICFEAAVLVVVDVLA